MFVCTTSSFPSFIWCLRWIMEHQSTVNQSTAMADNVLRQHSCGLLGNHYWQQLGSNPVIVRTLKLLHWRQGSTFEGTCQEGQVNLYSYLPNTILTSPAKGVIEWTWKWPFCMYYTWLPIKCFPAIALSELLEYIGFPLDFPCVLVSLKLHDEILPAM